MPEVSYPLDQAGLRVIDVLLVEDDPGDVLMTREAFELSPVPSTLHVVGDGEQAMHFLRRTGEFTGAPRPGLILLDLNLPRRNGLEVLAELKADHDLLTIPVVMFTTSRAQADILASYQLHANAYITKPVSFDLFTEAIRQVDDFFLTLAKLPDLGHGAYLCLAAFEAACPGGQMRGGDRNTAGRSALNNIFYRTIGGAWPLMPPARMICWPRSRTGGAPRTGRGALEHAWPPGSRPATRVTGARPGSARGDRSPRARRPRSRK